MQISVLGAGGWGTTLAILLHNNGHKITLWEFYKNYAKQLSKTRINKLYLPNVEIPEEINITHDLEIAATNQHIIVIAVPSQFVRGVLKNLNRFTFDDVIFVSVSKGIEKDTLKCVSDIISEELPQLNKSQFALLSGPSHAEEVSRKIPTTVVAASTNTDTASDVQAAFMNSYFRVYTSSDVIGVELGGALKNVIAIGAGIIDGANFGDNTKAAIMTRGIAEITRLGIEMGANPDTFIGLTGIGDLIVTCMSKHSRNRFVGEQIGKGNKLKDVLKNMDMVAEGVETTRSVFNLAAKLNVETPIVNAVYKILYEDKDPIKATYELMSRDKKPEV